MKIVHTSDLHGNIVELPAADLYIITGDMLKNYPVWGEAGCGLSIDKKREVRYQGKHIKEHSIRKFFGNKDAPALVVRGNHDFVNLSHWIGGEVYEFGVKPSVVEVLGLNFGGYRGVPSINGAWSDELTVEQDRALGSSLPDNIDFLITHAPPHGVRDKVSPRDTRNLGLLGASNWVTRQLYDDNSRFKGHFFGHIHEAAGFDAHKVGEKTTYFSNAATGYNCFTWDKGELLMTTSYRGKL